MKNRALIAAIAVLGITAAGCGSSSKTTTTSSAAATSSSSTTTASTTSTAAPATTSTSSTTASAGGGAASFKAAFADDKTQFSNLGATLQSALTGAAGKTDAQLATELGKLGDQAKAQADKLSQLSPPPKYKATLDSLVTALNKVSSDLKTISQAAVNHDATTAKSATTKLIQDAVKVKAADVAITSGLGLPSSG